VDKPDWILRLAGPTIASPLKWKSPRLTPLTWGLPAETAGGMTSWSCASCVAAVLIFSNPLQFSRNLINVAASPFKTLPLALETQELAGVRSFQSATAALTPVLALERWSSTRVITIPQLAQ